jgi:hypothetical protein
MSLHGLLPRKHWSACIWFYTGGVEAARRLVMEQPWHITRKRRFQAEVHCRGSELTFVDKERVADPLRWENGLIGRFWFSVEVLEIHNPTFSQRAHYGGKECQKKIFLPRRSIGVMQAKKRLKNDWPTQRRNIKKERPRSDLK